MKSESELVGLCIEAACQSRESVQKWRMQRRSLERLPSPVADALLRRLIARRLLYPSLLEYSYSLHPSFSIRSRSIRVSNYFRPCQGFQTQRRRG